MHEVYLSLGSNIGDRIENLTAACQALANHPAIELLSQSAYYQTSPVGGVVQDDFINQVVRIQTSVSAHDLLDYIHKVEAKLLRQRMVRWGPRTIDIDILFYDQEVYRDSDLTIPHKEIFNRLFVLVPLAEIMTPDFYQAQKVDQAIKNLQANSTQKIERV